MKLKPFLLDQWLQQHDVPPVEFNLASSTGPHWKLGELLDLAGDDAWRHLRDSEVVYSRTAGQPSLRRAIAEMQGVPEDQVIVLVGAQEALFIVFFQAAEPGANVIVPFPCFPAHQAVPESLGLEVRSYPLALWRNSLAAERQLGVNLRGGASRCDQNEGTAARLATKCMGAMPFWIM